jgi:hypothetical protein
MAMDMLGMTLRAMGVDPNALFGQAMQLGNAFEKLISGQEAFAAQLDRIEANQHAIMTAMGIMVPPPSEAMALIIAAESRRFMDDTTVPVPVRLPS